MRWYNFFHIYQPPAWDETIIRRVADESYRPVLAILQAHPDVKITLNITGALTEQLVALELSDVIEKLKQLVQRGQVELVGSAMYHPILPLLPDREIEHQINLQQTYHEQVFGSDFQPQGFYCPEMAYAPKLDPVLKRLGYRWIIVDEICGPGNVGTLAIDRPYQTTAGLRIVFRNRNISDYLSFSSDLANPADSLRAILQDDRSQRSLITAMDGENLGHHRHGTEHLWEFLVTYPDIRTGTLSEFVDDLPADRLEVNAGSWSSQPGELARGIPFGLWNHPGNPIHHLQWELTYLVIEIVNDSIRDVNYPAARRLLDRCLASDRYWWASASPWWDMAIIIRESQKLADAITPLTSVSASSRNKVEHLVKQIATTVELWDRTGLARKRQTAYLQDTQNVHYMAGSRVDTNQ